MHKLTSELEVIWLMSGVSKVIPDIHVFSILQDNYSVSLTDLVVRKSMPLPVLAR